jgi:hypothetical protein
VSGKIEEFRNLGIEDYQKTALGLRLEVGGGKLKDKD